MGNPIISNGRVVWIEVAHRLWPQAVRRWLRWRNRRSAPWVLVHSYTYLPEYRRRTPMNGVGRVEGIRFIETKSD